MKYSLVQAGTSGKDLWILAKDRLQALSVSLGTDLVSLATFSGRA